VRPDLWGIRVSLRAKVSQNHQVLDLTRIFEGDAGFSRRFRAEDFVFRQFGESDELGAIEDQFIHFSAALDDGQTVRAVVTNGAFRTRFQG
jgi:hypothetical protein